MWCWAWVALTVRPGIATAPVLCCADVGFDHEYILPIDFKSMPLDNCSKVEKILLSAINALDGDVEKGNVQLKALSVRDEINNVSRNELSDIDVLHTTLQKVIKAGVSPKEITQLLAAKFLS
jgi:hypothetical protein